MASRKKLFLSVFVAAVCWGACCQMGWAQTFGLGTPVSPAEVKKADISIDPNGSNLPPGSGSADQGAMVYADKCAVCHGDNGSGTVGPRLVKGAQSKIPVPCLSPCISDNNVMALRAPYATVIWDYINRGMPFSQEGSLMPNEVYAITAFLLWKNGVVPENMVLDQQSLPKLQMPNRDGYAVPQENWKDGQKRPLYLFRGSMTGGGLPLMYAGAGIALAFLMALFWVALRKREHADEAHRDAQRRDRRAA